VLRVRSNDARRLMVNAWLVMGEVMPRIHYVARMERSAIRGR